MGQPPRGEPERQLVWMMMLSPPAVWLRRRYESASTATSGARSGAIPGALRRLSARRDRDAGRVPAGVPPASVLSRCAAPRATKKVPFAPVAVLGSRALAVVGGLLVALGLWADLGGLLIVAFALPVARADAHRSALLTSRAAARLQDAPLPVNARPAALPLRGAVGRAPHGWERAHASADESRG